MSCPLRGEGCRTDRGREEALGTLPGKHTALVKTVLSEAHCDAVKSIGVQASGIAVAC